MLAPTKVLLVLGGVIGSALVYLRFARPPILSSGDFARLTAGASPNGDTYLKDSTPPRSMAVGQAVILLLKTSKRPGFVPVHAAVTAAAGPAAYVVVKTIAQPPGAPALGTEYHIGSNVDDSDPALDATLDASLPNIDAWLAALLVA